MSKYALGVDPVLRTHDELKAIAESGAAELGWDAPARDVIAWVARNFDLPAVAVACSMADAVLPALVADQLPGVDVLFLETGYHFPETYATRDEVAANLRVNVVDVLPERRPASGVAPMKNLPSFCSCTPMWSPGVDGLGAAGPSSSL